MAREGQRCDGSSSGKQIKTQNKKKTSVFRGGRKKERERRKEGWEIKEGREGGWGEERGFCVGIMDDVKSKNDTFPAQLIFFPKSHTCRHKCIQTQLHKHALTHTDTYTYGHTRTHTNAHGY